MMFPFLCEIALCFIVSYHVALLFLSHEPRTNREGADPEAAGRHSRSGR